MNHPTTPLASFAALAADLSHPASSAPSTLSPPSSSSAFTPTDSSSAGTKQYPSFAVHSPMSTASTASSSGSDSGETKGTLHTSRCSTPERQHSPLSLDATTASSSAASSRAASPSAACSYLTIISSPAARDSSDPGSSSHSAPSHTPISTGVSPLSHPVTPPSPAHSSASLSSSASSDHSQSYDPPTPTASSSSSSHSSSHSSNYRPDRRSGRSKRIPLSASQKALLEEFFRTNHYPTRDEKTELGQKIHLSSDKVHKWYDNRRTKMNKDSKLRRVEDARMQHLYNNFTDTTALYTTTAAVPFHVKPLTIPMGPTPTAAMHAMQLTPMAQSAAVHPFLHSSMLAAHAQQQDEAWKRAGMVADAQQQLLQAQMQYHMTNNALALQQQQQQQQAAVNNFFQSASVTPTSHGGLAGAMAVPLAKSTTNSAFHSVIPSQPSAVASRVTSAAAASATSHNSNLLSPVPVQSVVSTPIMHMRPMLDTSHAAFSTPAFAFPQMPAAMASIPASPAMAAHSLLSPLRPSAQLAFSSPLQHTLGGMSSAPMYVMRQ